MPLMWTLRTFCHAVFIDSPSYSGAVACASGSIINLTVTDPASGGNTTVNVPCVSYKGKPTGFYCPEDPYGLLCWGFEGADIMDSLGVRFDIYDSDTNYGDCILIILGTTSGSNPHALRYLRIAVKRTGGPSLRPHAPSLCSR